MTEVKRIDMSTVDDLAQAIKDECDPMYVRDFILAASFVYDVQLVLIFQKK